MTLHEAILKNSEIELGDKLMVYKYLHEYLSDMPNDVRQEYGSNEEIVQRLVERYKNNLGSIEECLNKLRWYGKN